MELLVTENPDKHRFEIHADGALAGFAMYRVVQPQEYAFTHTEIGPDFGGQGLGARLVGDTLDGLRTRGISVLPYCPFVKGYLIKHPEYVDVVPVGKRAAFGLESVG
jgi:predicted GNAT family acetyltransferase